MPRKKLRFNQVFAVCVTGIVILQLLLYLPFVGYTRRLVLTILTTIPAAVLFTRMQKPEYFISREEAVTPELRRLRRYNDVIGIIMMCLVTIRLILSRTT